MAAASHCSEFVREGVLVAGGAAGGFVMEATPDFGIYHARDTDVFLDTTLIAKLLRPQLALLPIGAVTRWGPVVPPRQSGSSA